MSQHPAPRLLPILGGAVLAIVAASCGVFSSGGKPSATGPTSVQRVTLTLVDHSRTTPANGTYPGAPSRTLVTVVSYPTRAGRPWPGRLPLVVFATGFGDTATTYAPLYDHWVEAGYVVAAPNFPLSQEQAPGGASLSDFAQQPADVSFVLSQLLQLNQTAGSAIYQRIDPAQIGLAGKSLGAITVLSVGYNPSHRDPRFKAVISLTGAPNDKSEFTGIDTPLLLEHGNADTTVPIAGSRDAYARAEPPKFFVTIFGATHSSAFGGGTSPSDQVVERTTIDFLNRYVDGVVTASEQLQRDGDVTGVASLQASP
jgi:predicted dienelactone hydrolase